MTPRDDSELLAAFVATRDNAAFAALVDRHLGMVYGCAGRQVNDPHLAEDVAQAVFILLAKKAHTIRSGAQLPGWLVAAARFCARDTLKRERRRRLREQSAAQTMSSSTQKSTTEQHWQEIAPLLDDALSRLSEPDRSAVALRYLEGRTIAGVAAALGISNDAAEKRVSRAIERLRQSFQRRGLLLPAFAVSPALQAYGVTEPPAHLAMSIASAARDTQPVRAITFATALIVTAAIALILISVVVAVIRSNRPTVSTAVAAPPASAPTTAPRRIKAGVIISYQSAVDEMTRLHEDGYKDQVEMIRALQQKPEVELFVIIDPGSNDKGEIPNILKKYSTPDHVVNGGDVENLKKLNVIISALRNGDLPDAELDAMVAAVSNGVGLLTTMFLGGEKWDEAKKLRCIDNPRYYWPNRETTARVLADHPIIHELTEQKIKTLRARPNGHFGIINGTPLIDAPNDTQGIVKPNGQVVDATYCFLYVGQLGKGRIVVGQWLRFPPDLDRATNGRFYIHCLQWLANQPVQ